MPCACRINAMVLPWHGAALAFRRHCNSLGSALPWHFHDIALSKHCHSTSPRVMGGFGGGMLTHMIFKLFGTKWAYIWGDGANNLHHGGSKLIHLKIQITCKNTSTPILFGRCVFNTTEAYIMHYT